MFQISHINFWHYLWISFVNTLPEEFMWTYAGRNARNIADVVKGKREGERGRERENEGLRFRLTNK
jgi:hypothetical protein